MGGRSGANETGLDSTGSPIVGPWDFIGDEKVRMEQSIPGAKEGDGSGSTANGGSESRRERSLYPMKSGNGAEVGILHGEREGGLWGDHWWTGPR